MSIQIVDSLFSTFRGMSTFAALILQSSHVFFNKHLYSIHRHKAWKDRDRESGVPDSSSDEFFGYFIILFFTLVLYISTL